MFKAVFSALKRAFDLTLAPIILGALAILLEWLTAGVSWIMVKAADFLISIISLFLGAIPFPDVDFSGGSLSGTALDFLSLIGFWPATGVIVLGGIARLIARMVSFGIVGNG